MRVWVEAVDLTTPVEDDEEAAFVCEWDGLSGDDVDVCCWCWRGPDDELDRVGGLFKASVGVGVIFEVRLDVVVVVGLGRGDGDGADGMTVWISLVADSDEAEMVT